MLIEKAVETKLYYKERFLGGGIQQNFSGPTSQKIKSKMKLKQNKNPARWLLTKSSTSGKDFRNKPNPIT